MSGLIPIDPKRHVANLDGYAVDWDGVYDNAEGRKLVIGNFDMRTKEGALLLAKFDTETDHKLMEFDGKEVLVQFFAVTRLDRVDDDGEIDTKFRIVLYGPGGSPTYSSSSQAVLRVINRMLVERGMNKFDPPYKCKLEVRPSSGGRKVHVLKVLL